MNSNRGSTTYESLLHEKQDRVVFLWYDRCVGFFEEWDKWDREIDQGENYSTGAAEKWGVVVAGCRAGGIGSCCWSF